MYPEDLGLVAGFVLGVLFAFSLRMEPRWVDKYQKPPQCIEVYECAPAGWCKP